MIFKFGFFSSLSNNFENTNNTINMEMIATITSNIVCTPK